MQISYLDLTTEPIAIPQSQVSEIEARLAANGYLSRSVGIAFGAVSGVYVPVATSIWQFAIEFRLPKLG